MSDPRTKTGDDRVPRSTFRSLEAAQAFVLQHPGRVMSMAVLHADACLHGRDHACTCSPDYVVEETTVEGLVAGQRAQREWLNRHRRN